MQMNANLNQVDKFLEYAKIYFSKIGKKHLFSEFFATFDEDCNWMLINDPSCSGTMEIKIKKCALAVAYYRFANLVIREVGDLLFALSISEYCKQITNLDIHPAASIKSPFAIDHGDRVVVGQRVKIGHHCLILDNTVIGARTVGIRSRNLKIENRHPTIGNFVTICGNSRIYGPINIGNNVFIGSDCLVVDNIPENSHVKNVSKLQIIKYGVENYENQ